MSTPRSGSRRNLYLPSLPIHTRGLLSYGVAWFKKTTGIETQDDSKATPHTCDFLDLSNSTACATNGLVCL